MKFTKKSLIDTIKAKNDGKTSYQARKIAGVSVRRVDQIYEEYLKNENIPVFKKVGRQMVPIEKWEIELVKRFYEKYRVSASTLNRLIERDEKVRMSHHRVHKILLEIGYAKSKQKFHKRKIKWKRYERMHSLTAVHIDWHYTGKIWVFAVIDDSSRKLNLNAGDEIDIIEDSGSLHINGRQNNEFKSTMIDIKGFSVPLLWRFFQSAYRESYDEIKIKYGVYKKDYEGVYNYYATHFEYSRVEEKIVKKRAFDMISELVNRFIGMEIIEHGKGYFIIREMGEISSKEFESSLRRIFLLLLDLFDKVKEIIERNEIGDMTICKTIHQMDINIDRFIDYCCRINNKINDSSFQENKPVMFSTLYILELLGDEFKYVGTHLAKSKSKLGEILPFIERVKEHFEMYYHLFYKFDRDTVIKFGENDFKIYNDHFKWKDSKNKDAQSIRQHFMQISKFVFVLMELRIEMDF